MHIPILIPPAVVIGASIVAAAIIVGRALERLRLAYIDQAVYDRRQRSGRS